MNQEKARHVALIVGGAVSGSEAAFQLSERGVLCIVVDQHSRPYGKIEDGLPRWHEKLRLQEQGKIDAKLSHPDVHLIPRTKVGLDLSLSEILGWGLSAVVFANGAWLDRPLPLPGIDRFCGKGFYYQNEFVYQFNHYLEPSYRGPEPEFHDGALVIGGGLASLDVVKILMLETVTRALDARSENVTLLELEHHGIRKVLDELGLTLSDLKLEGCTLLYRRRIEDMPVAHADDGASPEQIERTRATRRKLLLNFVHKYVFHFQDERTPLGYFAEGDRLTGLRMGFTETVDGKLRVRTGLHVSLPTRLVVSSIGSIPEPIPGLAMEGEVYRLREERTGEVDGLERVFAIGNAVTGKGNIRASRNHGRLVSQHMLEHYLTGAASGYEEVLAEAASRAQTRVSAVADQVAAQAPLAPARIARIMSRVRELQERAGYSGRYREWIERNSPPHA